MEPSAPHEPSGFELAHLVGTVFAGRYQVLRLVSEGASIALFDVIDQNTSRPVSLKVVRPALAAAPSFRERFDDTMQACGALSHPNIAAVYDWGIAPVGATSTAYVVVEQLGGGSLRDMFDRGRRLSPSQALTVGLDACRALDYAHRRGFVHTELTPSKLVFGDDRRLRVIDFGLARLLGERDWANPEQVSTHVAGYAAPELGQGALADGTISGKADVYTLGIVLQEAVTGTIPFKADSTVATLAQRTGRLMPVSADLGPLASVLERAGRPDPDERSSAGELGKALVAAASKLPRPEPLPLFATGLFDVAPEDLRAPDDPTGGVTRKRQADPDAPTELLVVPVDEPAAAPAPAPEPVAPTDDLVILPIDTGIDTGQVPAAPGPVRTTAPTAAVPVIEHRAPRRRRGFPWKIVLTLLVIAALATLGVLTALYLARTPTFAVPNLVGMPEAEARNLVAPNQWVIDSRRERSDEVPEIDHVVRTAPGAGTELAEGEPFLIIVSEGPTLRALPDSTNVPLDAALIALSDLGIEAEPIEQFDEVVPAGTVISWSVPADATLTTGSQVLPGTVVQLIVSAGPEPRQVPDLGGVLAADARVVVESLKLTFTVAPESEFQFSDTVPAGAIVWQSVEPGAMVERGSDITVVLSKGPDVVAFPDLTPAATFLEAQAILEAAGFEARLTLGDFEGALQLVQIGDVTPNPGDIYPRGTVVFIQAFSIE